MKKRAVTNHAEAKAKIGETLAAAVSVGLFFLMFSCKAGAFIAAGAFGLMIAAANASAIGRKKSRKREAAETLTAAEEVKKEVNFPEKSMEEGAKANFNSYIA